MQQCDFLCNGILVGTTAGLASEMLADSMPILESTLSELSDKADLETFEQFFCAIIDGGQVDVLEALIRKGADVNVRSEYGNTPLHVATAYRKSNITIVKLLVSHGANVNAKDENGSTPLHNAAMLPNIEIVECLVSNGADVNVADISGVTPLDFARFKEGGYKKKKKKKMYLRHLAIVEFLSSIADCPT